LLAIKIPSYFVAGPDFSSPYGYIRLRKIFPAPRI